MISINPILRALRANVEGVRYDGASLYPSDEGICKTYNNPKMQDEVVFEYPHLDSLLIYMNRDKSFVNPIDPSVEMLDDVPINWFDLYQRGEQHDKTIQSGESTQFDGADEAAPFTDEAGDYSVDVDDLSTTSSDPSVQSGGGEDDASGNSDDAAETSVAAETSGDVDVGAVVETETAPGTEESDVEIIEAESEPSLPSGDYRDGETESGIDGDIDGTATIEQDGSVPAEPQDDTDGSGTGAGGHDSGHVDDSSSEGQDGSGAGSVSGDTDSGVAASESTETEESPLEDMSAAELKAECARLGLGQSGTRATMIKRINNSKGA